MDLDMFEGVLRRAWDGVTPNRAHIHAFIDLWNWLVGSLECWWKPFGFSGANNVGNILGCPSLMARRLPRTQSNGAWLRSSFLWRVFRGCF